jgi:hypothetical protein
MLKILLLVLCATMSFQEHSGSFSVTIELNRPVTSEEIEVKVQVKNLTGKIAKTPKNGRQDYKREKIRALGNYVIEIQKWESESYRLFAPSTDIDPSYEKEEYVTLQKGGIFVDTLYVKGFSFSRATDSRIRFPSGKYRLKIYFNPDMWATSEINGSNWIEFNIE